jgi:hypothetical protein
MKMRLALLASVAATAISLLSPPRASAVPIFAERYGFKCTQCHTAVPELNAFGEHFRRAGYRLPNVPQNKVVPIALRLQDVWTKDLLPSQTRRFNALAVAISTANFGPDGTDSYFARYLFGSQGAAGSLYYGFLQHVTPSNGDFQRVGLLPLQTIANPTQRLDTITSQPAYTYAVGHSSANFATPRLGIDFGKRTDTVDLEFVASFDEYHGAAYGAPAPPSDLAQSFARPELFATANVAVSPELTVGVLGLNGKRDFTSRTSGLGFSDVYYRDGVEGMWTSRSDRFELTGQQLWGRDDDSDGFGTPVFSSGGFVTAKYRPTHNTYVGVRYDAAANPFASRDYDFYAVWAPTIHARLVLEHTKPIGFNAAGQQTQAQLLFALPFEKDTAGQ